MAKVTLRDLTIKKISYDIDIENGSNINLNVKNEINLKISKDEDDNSFMLVIETSIEETKNGSMSIFAKSEIIFDSDEKITSYDKVIEEFCFPTAFEKISEKIDLVLIALGYPKLGLYNQSLN